MGIVKSLLAILALNATFAMTFLAVLSEAIDSVIFFKLIPVDAYPRYTIPAIVVLTVIPFLVAAAALLILGRLKPFRDQVLPPTLPRKILLSLVATGFVLTLMLGGPAADTSAHQEVVFGYKQALSSAPHRVGKSHPYFKTYLTIPLAPGLLVSYREGAWSGHGAYGAFILDAWYGSGTKTLWAGYLWGA